MLAVLQETIATCKFDEVLMKVISLSKLTLLMWTCYSLVYDSRRFPNKSKTRTFSHLQYM